MWLEQDETGFVTIKSLSFNEKAEKINSNCKKVSEMFDLFTEEQIKYIKVDLCQTLIVSIKSLVIYCGVSADASKSLYDTKIKSIKINEFSNTFDLIKLDSELIENTKDKEFNPFKTVQVY